MTIAGATNETESESLKNIRLTDGRPKDDASSDLLEISEDENQTDAEESDTEPNPIAKTQSGVIDEMEESEDKHSGTNQPNWKSNHSEDNSMDSADINQGDMGKEICPVGITQGKVFEGEYNRIEKPDRTSIPVVNIQAIDEIENCKHIQEKINMHSFLKVIDGIQTGTEKSATESDCSNKILTMDTEQMVERLHTGKEGTNGASNPSADVHPSDTAEQQRNSKEARDSQSGNQRNVYKIFQSL